MTRKQRQIIIEAFRLLKQGAEEGERLARLVRALDLGASDPGRHREVYAVKAHVDQLAAMIREMQQAVDTHIGANEVHEAAKFPRAKALSKSKEHPR